MAVLEPTTKRRKVRKGTQSCWQCRRRKVRCIFSSSSIDVCDNCSRRKTACVSQEYHDPAYPYALSGSERLDERMNRVEELVSLLSNPPGSGEPALENPTAACLGDTSNITAALAQSQAVLEQRQAHLLVPRQTPNSLDPLKCDMIAAWPTNDEIERISALSVGLSSHFHFRLCRSTTAASEAETPLITDLLHLPSRDAHPVLFARRLLLLGTFIQGVLPTAISNAEAEGFFPRRIMHRVVDSAIRSVTTKDELLNSVDAIECIMLEAIYHNYSGELRRSWMATRRAITVAQSMALHRGVKSPSVRFLDPCASKEIDLDHLTFRMAEMDGYLSVVLGLERSSLNTRHITSERALATCTPMERMQRIHYMAQDRIIARSNSGGLILEDIQNVDDMLQKAAAEMSPRWWLAPTFTPDKSDGTKLMRDMTRVMDQFAHYHLLVRLHLPYVLSTDRRHDHSRMVAVNASRELLNRFLGFRTSNPAHYYCRGSDFLAFIAATVLCVAHIKNGENAVTGSSGDRGFAFLTHSRLSDRGLMERTLDLMGTPYESGTDAISTRISRILRVLLTIEASASDGRAYNVSSSNADEEELECDGKLLDNGDSVRVHIPNFGSIGFTKGAVARGGLVSPAQTVASMPPLTETGRGSRSSTTQRGVGDDGGNETSLSGPYATTSCSPDHLAQSMHPACWGMTPGAPIREENECGWDGDNDFDLQGVDFALFDSLFGGQGLSEGSADLSWGF